jgi:hypothetical protein
MRPFKPYRLRTISRKRALREIARCQSVQGLRTLFGRHELRNHASDHVRAAFSAKFAGRSLRGVKGVSYGKDGT